MVLAAVVVLGVTSGLQLFEVSTTCRCMVDSAVDRFLHVLYTKIFIQIQPF